MRALAELVTIISVMFTLTACTPGEGAKPEPVQTITNWFGKACPRHGELAKDGNGNIIVCEQVGEETKPHWHPR